MNDADIQAQIKRQIKDADEEFTVLDAIDEELEDMLEHLQKEESSLRQAIAIMEADEDELSKLISIQSEENGDKKPSHGHVKPSASAENDASKISGVNIYQETREEKLANALFADDDSDDDSDLESANEHIMDNFQDER